MPHYLIVEVGGNDPNTDLAKVRTAIHDVIKSECMRAGDIVLRNDRDQDSTGASLYEDRAAVARIYTQRATRYRRHRADKAAARAAALAEREARAAARSASFASEPDPASVRQRDVADSRSRWQREYEILTEGVDSLSARPGRRYVRDANGRFASRQNVEMPPAATPASEITLDFPPLRFTTDTGTFTANLGRALRGEIYNRATAPVVGDGQLDFNGEEYRAVLAELDWSQARAGRLPWDFEREDCTMSGGHCGPDVGHCQYCHQA